MENPFEIINQRLDRIEFLLEKISSNIGNNNVKNTYPEIMGVKELADYLKVSTSYVYKMTSSNQIPHSKNGKKLYFNKEKVTEWVLENSVMTQQEMQDVAIKYSLKRKLKN
jgi:excisionase family DNA binding protein